MAPGCFETPVQITEWPSGTFVHWLLYGIPPTVNGADEHIPDIERIKNGARQGRNGFGEIGMAVRSRRAERIAISSTFMRSIPSRSWMQARGEEVERAIRGHILAERT